MQFSLNNANKRKWSVSYISKDKKCNTLLFNRNVINRTVFSSKLCLISCNKALKIQKERMSVIVKTEHIIIFLGRRRKSIEPNFWRWPVNFSPLLNLFSEFTKVLGADTCKEASVTAVLRIKETTQYTAAPTVELWDPEVFTWALKISCPFWCSVFGWKHLLSAQGGCS